MKYKDDQCKIRLIYNNTLIWTEKKSDLLKKQVDVVERLVSIFVAK